MTMLNPFLRKVLIVDATISGAACLAFMGGADLTVDLLGLPSQLLFRSGVALIPFVATLVIIMRANAAPTGVVAAIIAIKFAWVAGSLFVGFGPVFAPTLLGKVFVCAQAAMVFLFAELQFVALRRPRLAARRLGASFVLSCFFSRTTTPSVYAGGLFVDQAGKGSVCLQSVNVSPGTPLSMASPWCSQNSTFSSL
jgi:hypothetical protein